MIYIICPPLFASGGPEALHQLGHKINALGFSARMCYDSYEENPVNRRFGVYNVPYCFEYEDIKNNIIVIPEGYISKIHQIKNAIRIIWWLSVDNAIYSDLDINIIKSDETILHMCQSHYAYEFLTKKIGISDQRIFMVSDYLNDVFLLNSHIEERRNIVLYNPQKGMDFTKKIIAACTREDIVWKALENMTPEQVRDNMAKSKVYIDFGGHPGKDRIPREAAVSGCLVITNDKGSAGNDIDVNIPRKYKYSDNQNIDDILVDIYELIDNYQVHKSTDFAIYINEILHGFREFEEDVVQMLLGVNRLEVNEIPNAQLIHMIMHTILEDKYNDALFYLALYRLWGYELTPEYYYYESIVHLNLGEIIQGKYVLYEGLNKYQDDEMLEDLKNIYEGMMV